MIVACSENSFSSLGEKMFSVNLLKRHPSSTKEKYFTIGFLNRTWEQSYARSRGIFLILR